MEYLMVNDNIHLQQLKLSHTDLLFETIDRDRKYLRKWLPFVDQTRKPKDTAQFIRQMEQNLKKNNDHVYTVWYKGDFAGLAGYKDSDKINRKTEIGYWLAESMQGKGIMVQTVKKLVDFAFRNLNINRVQIKVAVGNHKSAAIPAKLEFHFEGIEREGEFHTDRFYDLEVFSMLKKEWSLSLLKNSQSR
jgi:ribosomal-protein-serine acetyltransferase